MDIPRSEFLDYDDGAFYEQSQEAAQDQKTRNFMVEFGEKQAQIAFDVTLEKVKQMLEGPVSHQRPVRWM
jgi:predicted nuclease of restriction endonuclease-like (RecB) superfamily